MTSAMPTRMGNFVRMPRIMSFTSPDLPIPSLGLRSFSGNPRRVLVCALADIRLQRAAYVHCRFAVFVAQTIGGGERLLPPVGALEVEGQRRAGFVEARGVHAQQTHFFPRPVAMEQSANLREDGVIACGRLGQRMCASNGMEVGVAQLELNGTGGKALLTQSAGDHLCEPGQRGFQDLEVGGVFVESMFVADGFCRALADLFVEPSAGIFAAGLASHGGSISSKMAFEALASLEIGEGADTKFMQTRLGHL